MMKVTLRSLLYSQHRTPIIPQAAVNVPKDTLNGTTVRVGYFLARQPLIKSEPHPVEIEMSYMLQREHQRYSRHDTESYTKYLADKEFSGDSWNRMDSKEIVSNFFGLELYQDAIKGVLSRYKPNPRVTEEDYIDLFGDDMKADSDLPPARYTINRHLGDYLFLIVKDKVTGKWTIPSEERASHESLKTTAQRAIHEHHTGALDTFVWSNAPQAVLKDGDNHTFIYNVAYLSGRPNFEVMAESYTDHAWVTRNELRQYGPHFAHGDLEQTLLDIAPSGLFESP